MSRYHCYKEWDSLVILDASMGEQVIENSLKDKIDQLEKLSTRLPFMEHHDALFILRNSFPIPKLTYILRTSPRFNRRDLLDRYNSTLWSALRQTFTWIRNRGCKPISLSTWAAWDWALPWTLHHAAFCLPAMHATALRRSAFKAYCNHSSWRTASICVCSPGSQ